MSETAEHDAFISHASEDKESFVAPLANGLHQLGVKVWYDQFALRVGDSLSRSIDKGLAHSRFGIVVLSPAFLSKPWPEYELRGLTTKEIGGGKVILPIWHGVSREDVPSFSPPLADKYALDTRGLALNEILVRIVEVVRPDIYSNIFRLRLLRTLQRSGKKEVVSTDKIHSGPIRHKTLPSSVLTRIELIHAISNEVFPGSLKDSVDSFRRDMDYDGELQIWERMALTYFSLVKEKRRPLAEQRQIFEAVLLLSMGTDPATRAGELPAFSEGDFSKIRRLYFLAGRSSLNRKSHPGFANSERDGCVT